jgi:hypothetical protein
MPKASLDEEVISSELRGRTLRVYWYMLRCRGSRVGVREVQRALGFTSPSVALFHLRKLVDLGLVESTMTGEYFLVNPVKTGVLKLFVGIGRFMLPRYVFYSVLMSTMFVMYVCLYSSTFSNPEFQPIYITGMVISLVACVILWFETFKLWREKPF